MVRYSSDFVRKQNFGFYNTQLLNETNMIRRNYAKILNKSPDKVKGVHVNILIYFSKCLIFMVFIVIFFYVGRF